MSTVTFLLLSTYISKKINCLRILVLYRNFAKVICIKCLFLPNLKMVYYLSKYFKNLFHYHQIIVFKWILIYVLTLLNICNKKIISLSLNIADSSFIIVIVYRLFVCCYSFIIVIVAYLFNDSVIILK